VIRVPAGREFISCDWGTSSFRLRFVRGDSIVHEHLDLQGCRTLFQKHRSDQRAFAFEEHLRSALKSFRQKLFSPVPLLISGMASSSIGWKELPYARVPFLLDATNLVVQKVDWNAPQEFSATYLVSGVATDNDMMRGEETEAIGLIQLLDTPLQASTLVLPGTHSKHLRIEHDAIIDICTHMTGELYDLLSHHSILRASVDPDAPVDLQAFIEGVDLSQSQSVLASLFQTRTREVLHNKTPATNASFLSGLLIGAELSSLQTSRALLLGGSDSVRPLYAHAAHRLRLDVKHVFTPSEIQLAVPRAHQLILSKTAQ
jgi:2-dehydro-3-deoxygalactonokinase